MVDETTVLITRLPARNQDVGVIEVLVAARTNVHLGAVDVRPTRRATQMRVQGRKEVPRDQLVRLPRLRHGVDVPRHVFVLVGAALLECEIFFDGEYLLIFRRYAVPRSRLRDAPTVLQ